MTPKNEVTSNSPNWHKLEMKATTAMTAQERPERPEPTTPSVGAQESEWDECVGAGTAQAEAAECNCSCNPHCDCECHQQTQPQPSAELKERAREWLIGELHYLPGRELENTVGVLVAFASSIQGEASQWEASAKLNHADYQTEVKKRLAAEQQLAEARAQGMGSGMPSCRRSHRASLPKRGD